MNEQEQGKIGVVLSTKDLEETRQLYSEVHRLLGYCASQGWTNLQTAIILGAAQLLVLSETERAIKKMQNGNGGV